MKKFFNKINKLAQESTEAVQQQVQKGKAALQAIKMIGELSLENAKESITHSAQFNKIAKLFTNPTDELVKEIRKNIFDLTKAPVAPGETEVSLAGFKTLMPSIDKINALIAEGADLNAARNDTTPLMECARKYSQMINHKSPDVRVVFCGHEVTADEWQAIADHYLDVAKVLVEAGADPRVVNAFGHGADYYLNAEAREEQKPATKPFAAFLEKTTKKRVKSEWKAQQNPQG